MDSFDNELHDSPPLPAGDIPTDPYDVDVDTAASLLGVGRTRLSQITSKGGLSFQRRKIGIRNRLFYRKSELLAYLERQFPNSPQFRSQAIAERWQSPPSSKEEPAAQSDEEALCVMLQTTLRETLNSLEVTRKPTASLRRVERPAPRRPHIPLKAPLALEVRHEQERRAELSNLNQKLDRLIHSVNTLCAKLDSTNMTINRMQHQQRQAPRPLRAASQKPENEHSITAEELRSLLESAKTPKRGGPRSRRRSRTRSWS